MKCRSCGAEVERSGRWRLSDAHSAGERDTYGYTTSMDGLSNVKTAAQGRRYGVRKKKPSSDGIGERNDSNRTMRVREG